MISLDPFVSFNIAIILLLLGKAITLRSELLRRYSIPEPVVGGLLCAGIVAFAYVVFDTKITFHLEMRDFLLLLFFAGIGLSADVATLKKGGWPLFVLLFLASSFMIVQNLLGISIATMFGLDPMAGLMVGSVSLTGGIGTTAAWAPIISERFGIENAMELGVASNMVGLISACIIGGPIATYLMKRHKISTSGNTSLDVGVVHDDQSRLSYFSILWAILALNIAIMLGLAIDGFVKSAGVTLPTFVSCLIAGIVLRNVGGLLLRERGPAGQKGIAQGMSLLSDLSLGLFLIMALMELQLWQLSGVFIFIVCALTLQIILTALFTVFVVFRAMGRDYEASVICAGFGGITLGSTATAIANMTAVTQQYGAAHRAFIIVPVVCGFFIDIVNAVVISMFVG